MATIYKRRQDRRKKRTCWYIGYVDHNGKRRTRKGFTDRSETERLAAKLEEEARLIREGLKEPMLDALAESKRTPICEHVGAFLEHLRSRDVTVKQVSETGSRLEKMIDACGMVTIADVTEQAVESFLHELRSTGRSKQTSNHYLKAIKQFTKWLVRTKRLDRDPVCDIRRLNVQTDRRHDRRALSGDEFALLIAAAEQGRTIESVCGSDRAMMYVLSAWTGYRKGEIGSLSRQSFDLDSQPPTVTVEAAFSKRRRLDTQVLHADVVQRLRAWFAEKSVNAGELLFPVSGRVPGGIERKTHKMMQADLECARKSWIESAESDEE